MFMMMMMLLMTMMMLIKRSNSTAPWNWFHEPILQHRETNSMMYVKLVRETIFTAPWHQLHGAVEFNCELKPQFHGAVEYFPRPSEQIPRTFWKQIMVPWNWYYRLHGPVELISRHHGISHIIYLWFARINHAKAYSNEKLIINIIRT